MAKVKFLQSADISERTCVEVFSEGVIISNLGKNGEPTEQVLIRDWEVNRLITELMAAHKAIKKHRGQF